MLPQELPVPDSHQDVPARPDAVTMSSSSTTTIISTAHKPRVPLGRVSESLVYIGAQNRSAPCVRSLSGLPQDATDCASTVSSNDDSSHMQAITLLHMARLPLRTRGPICGIELNVALGVLCRLWHVLAVRIQKRGSIHWSVEEACSYRSARPSRHGSLAAVRRASGVSAGVASQ
jgi:hypothetical protein